MMDMTVPVTLAQAPYVLDYIIRPSQRFSPLLLCYAPYSHRAPGQGIVNLKVIVDLNEQTVLHILLDGSTRTFTAPSKSIGPHYPRS